MEPHREEQNRAPPPGAEPKPKRFRIVKLEERIAPKHGKPTYNGGLTCQTGGNYSCGCTLDCTATAFCDPTW